MKLNNFYLVYRPKWDELYIMYPWGIVRDDYIMNIEGILGTVHGVYFNIKDFEEDCVVIDLL